MMRNIAFLTIAIISLLLGCRNNNKEDGHSKTVRSDTSVVKEMVDTTSNQKINIRFPFGFKTGMTKLDVSSLCAAKDYHIRKDTDVEELNLTLMVLDNIKTTYGLDKIDKITLTLYNRKLGDVSIKTTNIISKRKDIAATAEFINSTYRGAVTINKLVALTEENQNDDILSSFELGRYILQLKDGGLELQLKLDIDRETAKVNPVISYSDTTIFNAWVKYTRAEITEENRKNLERSRKDLQ
jgi:hypothetical protein